MPAGHCTGSTAVKLLPAASHEQEAALPLDGSEARWYAAYTCSRHEKSVAEQLVQRSVEHLLPVYEAIRRWKDRRVRLELPLFPSYVFVHIALRDRMRVLQIPSVVRLVSFNGLPAALPDSEMEIMRSGLSQQLRAAPHPFLTVGRRARVVCGPLTGMEGIIVRKRKQFRFVVSLELILRSVAVEIPESDLMPIFQVQRKLSRAS